MPSPDKNEPSRITRSRFVGGNYTRHKQHEFTRLQNSRFRKAGSAVSVILECEAREPHTLAGRLSPFSLAVFSLAQDPSYRSNMVRRSRSQKNTAVLQSMNLHSVLYCTADKNMVYFVKQVLLFRS